MNRPEIQYYPNQRLEVGFLKSWLEMFRNIIKSRQLIAQLFKRDFFGAYKKSFLGIGWLLISPFIGIASWLILQSANILNPGETQVPFALYVLVGSSIWGLFMGFYSSALGTLNAGAGFIMQVNYPHEVLLFKQLAQQLANFTITFSLNLLVMILFGVIPTLSIILFPLVILPIFFLGAGIGLLFSVISVVASDISNIIGIILTFTFYITPVIYVKSAITSELIAFLVKINPLTYIISAGRDILLYGRIDDLGIYLIVSFISFIIFMLSWRLFYVSEGKVIEKML